MFIFPVRRDVQNLPTSFFVTVCVRWNASNPSLVRKMASKLQNDQNVADLVEAVSTLEVRFQTSVLSISCTVNGSCNSLVVVHFMKTSSALTLLVRSQLSPTSESPGQSRSWLHVGDVEMLDSCKKDLSLTFQILLQQHNCNLDS